MKSRLFHLVQNAKGWIISLGLNSWGQHLSLQGERKIRSRELSSFHKRPHRKISRHCREVMAKKLGTFGKDDERPHSKISMMAKEFTKKSGVQNCHFEF